MIDCFIALWRGKSKAGGGIKSHSYTPLGNLYLLLTLFLNILLLKNFEVTTSRIHVEENDINNSDLKPTGYTRQFTRDWYLDSCQRDLTINAMFLTLEGDLVDYHRGEEDLRRGRVRFVGDARHRLREDHQRILRYFRFRAQLSSIIGADDPYDSDTLEVLREEGPGLKKLAGMRIWPELKKILNFKGAGEEVKTMWKLGLFPHCGLPIDSTQEQVSVIIQFDLLFITDHLVPPCRITIVTTQLSCSLICQTMKCSSVPHSLLRSNYFRENSSIPSICGHSL